MESAPRAYRLKAGNAAPPISTLIGTSPDWYRKVLSSPEFFAALLRSLGFSVIVLLIEVPLGIYIALRLPAKGLVSSLFIVLMAIPLLTPYIVVGHLWQALTLPNAGLLY